MWCGQVCAELVTAVPWVGEGVGRGWGKTKDMSLLCHAGSFCEKNILVYHMYNFKPFFFKSGEGKHWRGKGRENETEEEKEEVSSPSLCLSVLPPLSHKCSATQSSVLRSREKLGATLTSQSPPQSLVGGEGL